MERLELEYNDTFETPTCNNYSAIVIIIIPTEITSFRNLYEMNEVVQLEILHGTEIQKLRRFSMEIYYLNFEQRITVI